MSDSDVQVKFGAQIDGLVAGINDAKTSLESLTGPIGGIMDAFQGLGEAAVAGFALDKVYDYERELASLGEEIERTANLTGLSTDQVQQFQFAVKMTGGDAETAGASLLLLERNIAEAQSGSGRAYTAFVNLGVSINDLKTKSPNDILQIMAQRFSETGDNAQQAAIKIDYMRTVAGRAGTNLIPLLNQGPEGLQKLNEVLDSTNSKLSPGMVEALAEAKRTSIEADSAWKGFYQTIGSTGFFDAVNHDLIDLAHAATNVANAIKEANREFDNFITDSSDRIPTETEKFTAAANQFKMALAGGGKEGTYGPPAPTPGTGNPLPALPTGTGPSADDADKVQEQIDRSAYQTSLEVDKLKLEDRKETDAAMVASGKMSAAQQIADLQQMAAQEYQLELQAVDNLASTYDTDSAEYAELQNKKLVLAQQFANEQAKLNEQLAATQKKTYEQELAPWKSLMSEMGGAADQMISGVLMGTQTLSHAFAHAASDMVVKFAESMAKMTAEYAVFKATQTGGNAASGLLGFGTTNPFSALGGQGGGGSNAATTALTSAITGNTASTVGNTGGILQQLESMIQSVAQTLGLTTATTAQATATTASTAATTTAATATTGLIPTISANIAALTANTTALIASKALPSYDVGSWSVPGDMVAQIHKDEMIIPAAQAAQIRSGSASIGGVGPSIGGSSGGANVQMNVTALDSKSIITALNNPSVLRQLSRNIGSYMASNPSVRGAY